ncbi:MAG: SiaB family protein kinase [Arcobacteraceae bacterium]|nr:SiaB family protein kinase [Arcobacteraceae bacterium]
MKSLLILFLVFTHSLSAYSNKPIKIVYNSGTPPLKFTDKNNQANGMLIDIWKLWSQKTGLNIEFIEAGWDDTLLMVKEGKVDIHGGLYYTKERDEYLDYTAKPFYTNKNYFFHHKSITNIKNNDDILPFVVGVGNGYPRKFMKENYPNVLIKKYDKNTQTIQAIKNGEIKIVLNSLPNFIYSLKQNQIDINDFKYVEDHPAFVKKYFGAVQKGNKELLKLIDEGFLKISDIELKNIEDKWTKNLNENDILLKSSNKVELTNEEKNYLKSKKIINMCIDPDWLPFEAFNKSNNHIGMANDYIEIMKKNINNLNINPIVTKNWQESIEFAKQRKCDIFSAAASTDERLTYMDFTQAYMNFNLVIATKDSVKKIDIEKVIKSEKLGVVKGYAIIDKLKSVYPNINIVEVDNLVDGLIKVSNGEIFGFVDTVATIAYNIKKKSFFDIKIAYTIDNIPWELSIGTRNDQKQLLSIFNKAIETLSNSDHERIYDKWLKVIYKSKNIIKFTKKEKAWLRANPTIKVISNPAWPPFAFINKKTNLPDGIATDYLKLVSSRTGIKFKYVKASSWDESIKKIQAKEVDMFGVIKKTPSREKYLNFTDTYISFPIVGVTKSDIAFVTNIEDIKDKKFAMIKNFSLTERLKAKYPNLDVVLTKDAAQAMNFVSTGQADIFIGSLGTVSYLLKEHKFVNLKIAGKIGIESSWGIGIRNDLDPEMISIFNKALKSVTRQEKNEILNKWIYIKFDKEIDYTLIYQIIALFIFFLIGTLYWTRKLSIAKKAVDESEIKTRSIIENSQDALIVIDADSKVVMWNNAATTIFGFNENEMIGKSVEAIIPVSFRKLHFAGVSRVAGDGKQNLIGKGAIEIEGLHKDGTIIPIDLALNTYIINNENFYSANIRDISERKKLAEALEEEKQFINSVINSQENFVITSDGKCLKTANSAFLNFYNVKDTNEFLDKFGDCICDTFDTTAPKEYIQKIRGEEKWIDYIYNRPAQIHKTMIEKDNKKYIFTITADKFTFKGEELKVAVFTDITQMEKVKKEVEQILANILLPVLITSKKDRKILYANKYAQQQYEKQLNEIIGSDIDNIYTIKGQQQHIIDEIENKGFVENLEEVFKTSSGKEFTALLSVTPISYKDEECYIGMVTDISKQKEMENEVRAIHKHTRESIEYASLIQGALIPDKQLFNNYFKDSFVIWRPKDIVGGDIYLFEELRDGNECLLMCIDCTGHGVAGAFVTMLVKAIERQISAKIENDKDIDVSPAWILSYFNKKMKQLLKQDNAQSISNAGFDGGIIYYNKKDKIIKFAGAEIPLFYYDENGEFQTIKGSRHSVGYKKCDVNYEYKEHIIDVKEGMKFYITTDGYLDQNGGEKDFPFGKKRFINLIKLHNQESMADQQTVFMYEMMEYENMVPDNDRNDDMTVIGFEIKENHIETILEYDGELTQSIITHSIDIIEHKITDIGMMGKVSTLTIELTQNMMNYSKSDNIDCKDIIPAGFIEVTKNKDDVYYVKSKNIVSIEDKKKIEDKLIEIQSLDENEIKKRYRELRRSGENTHEKGGGIGFYEIAKLAQSVEFEFKAINEEKFYFKFSAVANRTKN